MLLDHFRELNKAVVEVPQDEVEIVHIACPYHNSMVYFSCGEIIPFDPTEQYPEGLPKQDCVVCVDLLDDFHKEHDLCKWIHDLNN